MMTNEQVAEALANWQKMLETEAKKINGNIEVTYTMPDGGLFIIKYKLPKKGGK